MKDIKYIKNVINNGSLEEVRDMVFNQLNSRIELNNWGLLNAIRSQKIDVINVFLEHPNIDIHTCNNMAFHACIDRERYDILTILIDRVNV